MKKNIIILSVSALVVVAVVITLVIVATRKQRNNVVDEYIQYENYGQDIPMPDKEDSPTVPLEEMEFDLEKYQQIYDETVNK